jgi:hypothetical protein
MSNFPNKVRPAAMRFRAFVSETDKLLDSLQFDFSSETSDLHYAFRPGNITDDEQSNGRPGASSDPQTDQPSPVESTAKPIDVASIIASRRERSSVANSTAHSSHPPTDILPSKRSSTRGALSTSSQHSNPNLHSTSKPPSIAPLPDVDLVPPLSGGISPPQKGKVRSSSVTPHLSRCEGCIVKRRIKCVKQKWEREDAAAKAINEEEPFPRPPYRIRGGSRRRARSQAPAPRIVEDLPGERLPFHLPPHPSEALLAKLALPVVERLQTQKPPVKEKAAVKSISVDGWRKFLVRQDAHRAMKRRVELAQQKKVAISRDGPVYDRLFMDSWRDPYGENLFENDQKRSRRITIRENAAVKTISHENRTDLVRANG